MTVFLLFAETLAGKVISVDVGVADCIGDVKVKIEEKSGILADNQTLKIDDNKLEDSHNLNEYNINKLSTVHAVLRVLGSIEILIRNVNGKTFGIKVDAADTIETVKDKIFEKEGIPVNEQQLIFSGQDNVDDAALRRYIEKESTRHVFLRLIGVGRIYVDRVDHPSSPLMMEVDPSWTVKNITQLVTGNYGISSAQQQWLVASTAEELEDSRTFADYNVLKRSSLDMLLRVIGMIRITIQDMTGSTISIDCEPTDTLQKVRGKVQCRTGLPMEQVKVLYGDKVLDGDGPLSEFVTARIDVTVQLRLKGYVKIFIETQASEGFVQHVEITTTVRQLKKTIEQASDILEKYQKLFYCGVEMQDGQTLSYYFGNGSSDHYALFLSFGDAVKVEVDGGTLGRVTLRAGNSDTVAALKEKLRSKGAKYKDIKLLGGNGVEMVNRRTLGSYNVGKAFVLNLTMKPLVMNVKFIDRFTGATYDLSLNISATGKDLRVAAITKGFADNYHYGGYCIQFKGKQVVDSNLLSAYGITEGSTVEYRPR